MPNIVQFHFIILAVGEILKHNKTVTAINIQEYIVKDDAFGVRPPLDECRLALRLMENSSLLVCVGEGIYRRARDEDYG